jgi:hypothetical protein
MKHIKIYEDFNQVNEAGIPVYNDIEFNKTGGMPEMEVPTTKVLSTIEDLLRQKEEGAIDMITVVAEVPTQGKRKPQYVDEIIQKAKKEAARKFRLETGADIDQAAPSDIERAGVMSDIFFDSEFVVDRIESTEDGVLVVGYPQSLLAKAAKDPVYYSVYILPSQIEEIHFE